jgi:hypothetical protein
VTLRALGAAEPVQIHSPASVGSRVRNHKSKGGEVNRGIIGVIIGVLVIIILVIVILQLT